MTNKVVLECYKAFSWIKEFCLDNHSNLSFMKQQDGFPPPADNLCMFNSKPITCSFLLS